MHTARRFSYDGELLDGYAPARSLLECSRWIPLTRGCPELAASGRNPPAHRQHQPQASLKKQILTERSYR